jgi:hypothetical protein
MLTRTLAVKLGRLHQHQRHRGRQHRTPGNN